MKRLIKGLLITLVLLIAAAIALPYLFKDKIMAAVKEAANESLTAKLDFKDAAVRRVLLNMAPAILGVSVSQVSLVINTIFASFLVAGSVSWMYYADRLMELPTGVLGVALGTILLPTLSKHAANQDTVNFSALLMRRPPHQFLLYRQSSALYSASNTR